MKSTMNFLVTLIFTLNPISTFASGSEGMDPSISTSTEVTRNIHETLSQDSTLSKDAQKVKVKTSGKQVTLSGTVDSLAEKSKVEAVAQKYASRRTVQDNLNVKQ